MGRKGITQNVLACCTPDMEFTYVLAGWEGSANDFTVLKDALQRPNGLKVPEGEIHTQFVSIFVFYETLLDVLFYF
jgi:hypothetical protein